MRQLRIFYHVAECILSVENYFRVAGIEAAEIAGFEIHEVVKLKLLRGYVGKACVLLAEHMSSESIGVGVKQAYIRCIEFFIDIWHIFHRIYYNYED